MKAVKLACAAGAVLIAAISLFFAIRGPAAESTPRPMPTEPDKPVGEKPNQAIFPPVDARETLRQALKNYETALAVIANNLANVETSGFKASHVIWEDVSYRHDAIAGRQDDDGNRSPNSCSIGRGSRIAAIQIDFRRGRLEQTGRELDLAIDGLGFFQVTDSATQSVLYYRGGRFAINVNGHFTVSGAYSARHLEPMITIPNDATKVWIDVEGSVSVLQGGSDLKAAVGQIQLASFNNPEGLQRMGENLFAQTEGSGPPTLGNPGVGPLGKIRQGWIESSNVDPNAEVAEWKRLTHLCRTIRELLGAK